MTGPSAEQGGAGAPARGPGPLGTDSSGDGSLGAGPSGGVRGAARAQLRALLAAVMFLTRIPCPRWLGHEPDDLARSTAYFPLVGALVGAWGAAVYWAASRLWPPAVAVVAATAGTVWLTGAFHEDALADAADGFGGGWDRPQILAIMKDSRVGSYAVVALALALAAKFGALHAVAAGARWAPDHAAERALVAAHTLGRWSSLPLIWRYAYVRETGGKSKPVAGGVTAARLVFGSATAAAVAWLALGPAALACGAVAVAGAAGAGRYFRRRLGGVTGDCLGAANQLVELATYLVLAADAGRLTGG